MVALINKAALRAICDAKSVEISYIADKINCKSSTQIDDWVNTASQALPTLNQAKAIAKCLKIPFASLYMNPQDIIIKQIPQLTNRRTFPEGFIGNDSALNIAISDLITSRDFFIETKNELKEPLSPLNISINSNQDAVNLAADIRREFDIDLGEQYALPSARQFYLYVRCQVEKRGIFIHGFSGVDLEVIRGIAIYDNIMPIIGINEKDRYPAMTFSIIHELTHIIKRQSSLCNDFYKNVSSDEEVFCNAVAGELLIPREALEIKLKQGKAGSDFTLDEIETLANSFCVSKEVVIRRLLDTGKITQITYDTYADEIKRIFEKERAEQREEQKIAREEGRALKFGTDPVRNAIDKTSSSLANTLVKAYSENIFSKQDICRYVGIKPKSIDRFLQEVSK